MKDNNNSLAVPNLHIPPEAVEAAARELAPHPWSMYTDGAKAHFQAKATAAIRAALPYLVQLQNGGRHV